MVTQAKAAFGIKIKRGGVAVAEVLGLDPVRFQKESIDVTNHDSPGGYEELITKKVIRTGEISIRANSVNGDAGQIAIKSDWNTGTVSSYEIAFPDGSKFTGSAIITAYEYETSLEDQIIFRFTLKWTGAVTDATTGATAPSDLAIATATLYPSFDDEVYEYLATSAGDTCTVTLTFATSTAKLYREGVFVQDLTTATPSGNISLGVDGAVTKLTIVVSEDGRADRVYNINIANAAA